MQVLLVLFSLQFPQFIIPQICSNSFILIIKTNIRFLMISDKQIVCPNNLLDAASKKKGVSAAIVNAGKPLPMLSVMDARNQSVQLAKHLTRRRTSVQTSALFQ